MKLADDQRATARAVVAANGARYRRLDVDGLEAFEAASVHYWASPLEGKLCSGEEVALVGAGNSAGQATVYLASQAKKVWLLVRGSNLGASMSRYLVDRIEGLANVEVLTRTEISGLEGRDGHAGGDPLERRVGKGDAPPDWAPLFLHRRRPEYRLAYGAGVMLDEKGFVVTGKERPPGRWRPTCTGYSPWATSVPVLSSGSLHPSAKAPKSWRRCTPSSPRPTVRQASPRTA